jgi:predicted AAA+ superfamily ATPase
MGHLVEATVAVHLRRTFGDRVYYWRPDERRELDFVVAHASRRDRPAARGEVKYQARIDARDGQLLRRTGGGILVTRDFEGLLEPAAPAGSAPPDEAVAYALPAAELLVRLDAPALGPAQL